MKEKIIEVVKWVAFLVVAAVVLVFLTKAGEEEPHRVVVDGQEYIRSKEYVGHNQYQIIMIPVKSSKK